MKIVRIGWCGLSSKWSITTGSEGSNMFLEVFKSEDYGACVVVAAAYVQVGYKMVEPKKG